MNLKVGLKVGSIELSYEGSTETFESKFEGSFSELLNFGKERFAEVPQHSSASSESKLSARTGAVPTMTVKSIAAKLGGDSGRELVLSAIASLAIVQNKEVCTRQEIIDEMKLAVGYFKPSYVSGNLSKVLDSLSKKGIIIESSKDSFALKESARAEMEQKLAQ